jgi:hypothetical protein
MATRISSTIEQGRKYDIDFVSWTEDVQGLAQFTFGDRARKTTGLIKATNRFLKVLLTYRGTDLFNPNLGTNFEDTKDMGGDTISEIGTFVTSQIADALKQVRDVQSNNEFPSDENITSVVLTDIVELGPDYVVMFLRIIVESGEETTVKVPLIGG